MASKKTASFLPAAGPERRASIRGDFDVVIVTGDAYVDHPGFGAALIGRVLEDDGFRVAILAQPPWNDPVSFKSFGRPRLFFGITSGAVDAALNRLHSLGAKRQRDVYSPGGVPDRRPPRPLITYTALARQAYPGVPVVLGGLEASLKRLVHVDAASNTIRRPVLPDAKADMLVFGQAEETVVALARRAAGGETISEITDLPGTAVRLTGSMRPPSESVRIPGFRDQQADPRAVADAHRLFERHHRGRGRPIVQETDPGRVLVNPPAPPLSPDALDRAYRLPFRRQAHPMYGSAGIPALEPVRFSVVTHRGCFGGCAFCSLAAHQGTTISSRPIAGILEEIERFRHMPGFKGSIPDVGGPTANMYGMRCTAKKPCARPSCLFPEPCAKLSGPETMMGLLERLAGLQGIKIRVASGVRHDLALRQDGYIEMLASRFTGGQLKLAPEHRCPEVLRHMRKPSFARFEEFERAFAKASKKAGKEQYLVPYFISGHPGTTLDHGIELLAYLAARGWKVRQVQDFTPIPLTPSAAMAASGLDERGQPVHVPGKAERKDQLALLRFHMPQSQDRLRRVLTRAGRKDLLAQVSALADRPGSRGRRH